MDLLPASHTIVLSDIHLADAEPPHPRNPLWKSFKRPKHFVDASFRRFLEKIHRDVPGPIELVLNGDIFDFDSVIALPASAGYPISWLERIRGLSSEEPKSLFKMGIIIRDHPTWFDGLADFLRAGHRAVFVIGNHDMELHWPSVRQAVVDRLGLGAEAESRVRFCEWFYVSNADTLVEHGNQYDPYSLSANPIHPMIRKGHRIAVRIPFGNLAGRYMLNGMGLFNPHATSSYIRSSFADYLEFFYRYVLRTQPFLMWTYLWSAVVTLVFSVAEGLLPALNDPLTVDARVKDIASRANTATGTVWSLKEMHAHPAIFNPLKVLRELWLDRVVLLGFVFFLSFQVFTFVNVIFPVSLWWFVAPLLLLFPAFIFYARSVTSEVAESERNAFRLSPVSARIAGVGRVVQGHTHLERHTTIQGVEYLNTGTWSPAFHDVECTQPYGRKCFAWIHPRPDDPKGPRIADLFEWKDGAMERIQPDTEEK